MYIYATVFAHSVILNHCALNYFNFIILRTREEEKEKKEVLQSLKVTDIPYIQID